ncbi:MAG: 3D domain-containing protein [Candidatus Kerfeldbacteria bacterium]|nr:3D domain-containing protein [Candidatus Kerfeldbacteria bacterium]
MHFPVVNKWPARYVVHIPTTAYSSTVDQTDSTPFITASGTRVRPGVVAANFLPFGTRIRLPDYFGDQIFVVEDRMNERYNKRLDIWMESRGEAVDWGIRRLNVEVL